MSLSTLRPGDEVAVIPMRGAATEKVRELAIVAYVGVALVELDNGGLYFVTDGQGMNVANYIVPATEEHRTAISRRTPQTA